MNAQPFVDMIEQRDDFGRETLCHEGGIPIHLVHVGDKGSLAVVFIHGSLGTWAEYMAGLLRCVAFGCGLSQSYKIGSIACWARVA